MQADGKWMLDETKVKRDGDKIKIKYEDGTKIKIDGEEMKLKDEDGKIKIDGDSIKVKPNN
jgi:RNase P/RNase MRP subunit p29